MMDIAHIVRQVVHDYLTKLQQREHSAQIAILLEYESSHRQTIWEHIRNLGAHATLHLLTGEAWQDVPPDLAHLPQTPLRRENLTQLQSIIAQSEVLHIPNSAFAALSKLALLIDDDLSSALALHARLSGKQILLADNWLQHTGMTRTPSAITAWDKVQSYRNQLIREGIGFAHTTAVLEWIEKKRTTPSQRRVLLAKDVEHIVRSGNKEWTLADKEIVTPLAKDRAKELGLQLRKPNYPKSKEGRT